MLKARKGQHEDALRLARRSAELNPNDASSFTYLGMVSSIGGDFEQGLRSAEKLCNIMPGHALPVSFLGHTQVGLGDFAAATQNYRTAEELITDEGGYYMPAIIYLYGLMGRADDANRLFRRFESWSGAHTVGAGLWMYAYLGLRDAEKAYDWLGRAVEGAERSQPDAGFMAFLVLMSDVHDDPILEETRFQKLFKQIDAIARSR